MLAPSFFHSKALDSLHPSLDALYQDLHRNPELSLQEEKTSMKMAAQLRKLGFEVTERVGGHGAAPHLTKDPVLIAARSVVTFQSIVSREVSPFDAAIVTVGTFHAGSKRDIIADEAKLELTVRSYKTDVQKHLLEAMHVDPKVTSDVLVNDPALAVRLSISLKQAFGDANVLPISPSPASEDFGEFGCAAGVPSIQLRVGMVEPGEYAAAKAAGKSTPGSHTANFAPDRERTIRAGTQALAVAVMDLLRPGAR